MDSQSRDLYRHEIERLADAARSTSGRSPARRSGWPRPPATSGTARRLLPDRWRAAGRSSRSCATRRASASAGVGSCWRTRSRVPGPDLRAAGGRDRDPLILLAPGAVADPGRDPAAELLRPAESRSAWSTCWSRCCSDRACCRSCCSRTAIRTSCARPWSCRRCDQPGGGCGGLVEDLEIRYLANQDPNLYFALLTDFPDAAAEELPGDPAELLTQARAALEGLAAATRRTLRSAPPSAGLEPRAQNLPGARERGCWMGWERKRGKLEELNRLCAARPTPASRSRSATSTSCAARRYVLTLDTDTVPAARHGPAAGRTIAHPLVQAALRRRPAAGDQRLRVIPAAGQHDADQRRPVASSRASSPVKHRPRPVHDRRLGRLPGPLRRGSYFGKAIYEIDALRGRLAGRLPANHLLQPRPDRGHLRAGRAGDRRRAARTTPLELPCLRGGQNAGCAATGRCCPGFSGGTRRRSGRWKIFDTCGAACSRRRS